MAGYRANIHGKFTLRVWTVTKKEQEELGSGKDGFSGRKSPPEVPSDCPSVPLEHSGSAAPVLSQESAWFREEHTVLLGSFLALPYQLSTMHRSHPRAGGCWERRFPGGQEAPTVARAAALLDLEPRITFPSICNAYGPSPKDVWLWIISL